MPAFQDPSGSNFQRRAGSSIRIEKRQFLFFILNMRNRIEKKRMLNRQILLNSGQDFNATLFTPAFFRAESPSPAPHQRGCYPASIEENHFHRLKGNSSVALGNTIESSADPMGCQRATICSLRGFIGRDPLIVFSTPFPAHAPLEQQESCEKPVVLESSSGIFH